MRIGKWVPIYRDIVPLPKAFSTAFGLTEGAELHLAPVDVYSDKHPFRHDMEILVSPVPVQSWKSACRLSVRVRNRPGALATATRFLRDNRINILLTEACATFQDRGHWDAICDLRESDEFAELRSLSQAQFLKQFSGYLSKLTTRFHKFIRVPENKDYFPQGRELHAQFSELSGLNKFSYVCDFQRAQVVNFQAGAIKFPRVIVKEVAKATILEGDTLPSYAIITGNTEQRYLRVYFLRDYERMFKANLHFDLSNIPGGGIGILHQILERLPEDTNVLKLTNYLTETQNSADRGYIEIIGQWLPSPNDGQWLFDPRVKEQDFRSRVASLAVQDIDGVQYGSRVQVDSYTTPPTVNPRVFISYSTRHEEAKLQHLLQALMENNYQPVLGTDLGFEGTYKSGADTAMDVVQAAFNTIPTCVALISLQVKRDDFRRQQKIDDGEGYILPPWAVAEEVYAWSKGIGLIVRLRDSEVEDPRFNRHILTFTFSDDEDYKVKVEFVMSELNKYRQSPDFRKRWQQARQALFEEVHGPNEA